MADTRKEYSREFKEQAGQMLEEGKKSGHEIEAELGIGSGQVYWRTNVWWSASRRSTNE